MAGRHTNTVGRQRDRQSRTVRTGRKTDDHEQCRQTCEQCGQAERQTNSAGSTERQTNSADSTERQTNSVGRQRHRRTVRAGRDTDEQCGQAETQTDSAARQANNSGQAEERHADSIITGYAGRQAMPDEQQGQADRSLTESSNTSTD